MGKQRSIPRRQTQDDKVKRHHFVVETFLVIFSLLLFSFFLLLLSFMHVAVPESIAVRHVQHIEFHHQLFDALALGS